MYPITGKRHQLRLSMAILGHPIVGDGTYSFERDLKEGIFPRMMLHSSDISIPLKKEIKVHCESNFEDYIN